MHLPIANTSTELAPHTCLQAVDQGVSCLGLVWGLSCDVCGVAWTLNSPRKLKERIASSTPVDVLSQHFTAVAQQVYSQHTGLSTGWPGQGRNVLI